MIECMAMFKKTVLLTLTSLSLFASTSQPLDAESLKRIGLQIWRNESGGVLEGLTCWNAGEEFASLGINHNIWYPENIEKNFEEGFPLLIDFFKTQDVQLPGWLIEAKGCPWKTRGEFLAAQADPKMIELRQLLSQNIDLQIRFMENRLATFVDQLQSLSKEADIIKIHALIEALKQTPQGLYILLDYLNFKGTGLNPLERYHNQGWGLYQVLEHMEYPIASEKLIEEFVKSAKKILKTRVENSPAEREEERWMKGWTNRLNTYLQFS